jgi:hypothetical protein
MTFADWTGWRDLAPMEEVLQSTQDPGDAAF